MGEGEGVGVHVGSLQTHACTRTHALMHTSEAHTKLRTLHTNYTHMQHTRKTHAQDTKHMLESHLRRTCRLAGCMLISENICEFLLLQPMLQGQAYKRLVPPTPTARVPTREANERRGSTAVKILGELGLLPTTTENHAESRILTRLQEHTHVRTR